MWSIWTFISVLFLFCILLYLYRRKQKLKQLEESEAWRESLYESDQQTTDF